MSKTTVIIQLILFLILLGTLIYLSYHKKVTTIPKWVLAICTIVILAMADKIKLLLSAAFTVIVGIYYALKYYHRKKHKHGTKHNWELDS